MTPPTPSPRSLAVGTALPSFDKTFRAYDLMAYGAATWDWFRVHYDKTRATALGFPDVFVDGQHLGALFAKQAFDWAGPRSFIAGMQLRFRSMVFVDETVTATAIVETVSAGGIVTLSQVMTKGDIVAATCRTTLRLPLDDQAGGALS